MSVFEHKTSAELDGMDAVELGKYYSAKDAHNDNAINAVIEKSAVLQKNYEELSKFSLSQKDLIEKNAAQLKAQAEKLVVTSSNPVAEMDWLTKGLKDNADKFKSARQDQTPFRMQIKAVADMTKPVNINNSLLLPVPEFDNRLTRIMDRTPWISSLIRSSSISTDKYVWYDQSGREGAPAPTTEGTTKNQMDFNMDASVRYAKKYTAYIKASSEILDDIGWMRTEINNELISQLRLVVDADQLSGDGSGVDTAGRIFGLLTDATAFTGTGFALAVPEANSIDVLTIALDQVMAANATPNVILMNPRDVTQIKLDKASDGHYLERLLFTAQGMTLDGVPIVENNGMPIGEFLVMDSMKAEIKERQPVTINAGMSGDDFLNNKVTILAEWRGMQIVKDNHKPALVKGAFATAITIILKP